MNDSIDLTSPKRLLIWVFLAFSLFTINTACAQTYFLDSDFNLDVAGTIIDMLEQPDGKIIVAGSFISVNGVDRSSIARINSDGSLDTGFNPSFDQSQPVINDTKLQPDGKILIGGSFSEVNGEQQNELARLNSNGTLDTGFRPTVFSFFGSIETISVLDDGAIIAASNFEQANGVDRSRIAKFTSSGLLDLSFVPPEFDFPITHTLIQPDGKVVVAGNFTSIGTTTRNRIARLNSNGSLDTGFNPNVDGIIEVLAMQPDGKILIGGILSSVGGITRNGIARINSNGTLDTGFNPNPNSSVQSILLQQDKIYIGGEFLGINGVTQPYFARLNSNGTLDTQFAPDVLGDVRSIIIDQQSRILIGGEVSTVQQTISTSVARYDPLIIVVPPIFFPETEQCFPIKAINQKIAIICL
ncbi:MAG: delta-60 repeat domain-containing protein [Acidiferrobacterales bacterium]|nr:delta-60 repeat domain-containing protein [Acidiferrobacterales bacterium]